MNLKGGGRKELVMGWENNARYGLVWQIALQSVQMASFNLWNNGPLAIQNDRLPLKNQTLQ